MRSRVRSGWRIARNPAETVLFATVTVLLVIAAVRAPTSGNPASRLATIESLVDHQSWSLNDSVYRYDTVDKVRVGSVYYSSKPVLYPALGAVAYGAIRTLTGWRMAEHPRRVLSALRLLLQVVPLLIALVAVGRWLRPRAPTNAALVLCLAGLAPGSLIFGYSATINNHSVAAILVLLAWLAAAHPPPDRPHDASTALGLGLLVGVAVALDLGVLVFALALPMFLWASKQRMAILWVLAGAALPVLVHVHLTYRLTGSWRPFYAYDWIYQYPGSYWLAPEDFDSLAESRWRYGLNALLGHHGLFSMTPLLLFAVPGSYDLIRPASWRHETTPSRLDRLRGWFLVGVCVLTIGTYVVRGPHNYGGTCVGMRWYLIITPLLWYAATRFILARWHDAWVRITATVAVLIGCAHAIPALSSPWSVSWWNQLLRSLGLGSVE